ncbi:MAG: hypothetical protein B7Z55_14345, partial [Planctomycetales bacterium 12-60-4]
MPLSIRLKMTLWYAASLIATLFVLGWLLDAAMHDRLLARTDAELAEELDELVLELQLASDHEQLLKQVGLRFRQHPSFEFQIKTANGQRLFASSRVEDTLLPLPVTPPVGQRRFESARLPMLGDCRVGTQTIERHGDVLAVSTITSLRGLTADLRDLRQLLWVMVPLVVFVSAGGGYWLAVRALRPVDRMTRLAERVTAAQLDERVAITCAHDELGRLGTTLNAMMDRLQNSVEQMQQFTADAAHELRTPIAVIRSTAELALRQPRSEAYYQDSLQAIAEESERMTALADQLLLLAREDAG